MNVTILGTAAAEAWPGLFCHCDACTAARTLGGKNVRSRSGYLIDDDIKIDFGPDSTHHMLTHGLAYERLRCLLVSHSHWDHWVPEELIYRRRGFSVVPEESAITVYGNDRVRERADAAIRGDWEATHLRFVEIEPFHRVDLDARTYATPILAAHDPKETCVNWLVTRSGVTFLQAHDTGWWPEETWRFLEGARLDAIVVDTTGGQIDMERGHMGCRTVVRVKERLSATGALAPDCRFVATHFSHNGGWLHDELERFFEPHGIEVAWDGMRIDLA